MSFIDKVEVNLSAGRGGDGRKSFRRDRFIRKGGPDGGDGGDGGSIIFVASSSSDTLAAFRYEKELKAENGQSGGSNKKHGKRGTDLIVKVPVGTLVIDKSGDQIADLTEDSQSEIIARGGKGGFGNAHFTSSTRQAPDFAEVGEPGDKLNLTLELKLIADVGLVGMPNAGKSTLLSRISNARPLIADYPFTTLTPNLGVVDVNSSSFLVADIPGLIEGAAHGKGLGHEFLKHIERTKLIVHLIDIYNQDIVKSYKVIRKELSAYSKNLAKLPEIVVINKIDGLSGKDIQSASEKLKKELPAKTPLLFISALAGTNLDQLKYDLLKHLKNIKPPKRKAAEKQLPVLKLSDTDKFSVTSSNSGGFIISGEKIEHFAKRTDFTNAEAVDRLKDIMRRMGIIHELNRLGATTGNKIYFGRNKDYVLKY